ncbi:cation efflux protein [Phlegmacium glaucopus]|nr:cation efflux protein [Phlegmacium glaucopus]
MKKTTRLGIVLAISLAFFAAEVAVGFRTKSLALLADADVVSYAIAFAAAYLHERGQHTHSFTYAFHRAELVGAFFNGVFLLALALSICLQSIERFVHVETVDSPMLVLIVACVGLSLNIISAFVIHEHHGHSHGTSIRADPYEPRKINYQRDPIHATHNHTIHPPVEVPQHDLGLLGVLIHLLGDAANNVGVIVAALIMMDLDSPKRFYADPAVSLGISLIIFGSAIPMTLRSGRILLEASPIHLDLAKVKEDLLSIPDVLSIHDLHVWHLSQSVILGSLHVCVPVNTSLKQWETTERYLQYCFEEYGINHVTISPEIQPDPLALKDSSEGMAGRCRCSSEDDFGCAVSALNKRKLVTATV